MIPSGTRFIGISPTVDLTERRSALLNKQTEPFTVDDIRGYKVYTALLTQSGGDDQQTLSSEDLTIGITYQIIDNDDNTADFTNVGASNNELDTFFVATGSTPNSWGNDQKAQLEYNTGAPVATVLENTIGDIWFTYDNIGSYLANSNGLFVVFKTESPNSSTSNISTFNNQQYFLNLSYQNDNLVQIVTYDSKGTGLDDSLSNKFIEIRIYN